MHYYNTLVLLALSLPLVAHSKSIYIDKSCTSRSSWDDDWKETLKLAKRARERMDSSTDTDFEAVFKRVFQTEKSSDEGKYARSILEDIEGLSTVTDLKKSDIRMFCDNDKRWGDARANGGWYDKTNEMVTKNEPSCLKDLALGRVYERKAKAPTDKNSPRAGHNPDRVVVTICDATFVSQEDIPLRIDKKVEEQDLSDMPINYLSLTVSQTILHELAHAVSYAASDESSDKKLQILDLPDKEHAYGWNNVITKEAEMAVKNADNYAFLGKWAVAGDMGYTLPRVNEADLSDEIKKEREEDAVEGYLNKFTDITKRMLMPLVARAFSS
ncbi:unnamed protein product [Periconia digitata]|uniref:Lysine-specific metallo-endopeptidase domain-containing protein n=1 Tax=Periconia digitata TaxID=1303443 RepID=A0A9W4UUT4_9PLEO|nr:unnamed protein product [Periconia digitata]